MADALADEIGEWIAARRADSRFHRFSGHFPVLSTVLGEMLRAVRSAYLSTDDFARPDRCQLVVRRIFEWYSAKYDQRLSSRWAPVLAAADEVVRSCWAQPFSVLGRTPPTGPLAYVEHRFDAFATPRVSVPVDLRAPADAEAASYVKELPIPAICLPAWSAFESWWLGLVAHEVGHHVQLDLDLEAATRDLLGDDRRFAREVFADAWSVLMIGPGASWLVAELGGPEQAVGGYPPLSVRLSHMRGHPLQELGLDRLAGSFDVGGWPSALRRPDPLLVKLGDLPAARRLLAAAFAGELTPVVHENLLKALPKCGPEGTLGAVPRPDVKRLAADLAGRLVRV